MLSEHCDTCNKWLQGITPIRVSAGSSSMVFCDSDCAQLWLNKGGFPAQFSGTLFPDPTTAEPEKQAVRDDKQALSDAKAALAVKP